MLLYILVVTFPLAIGYMYDKNIAPKLAEGEEFSHSHLQQRWLYLIIASIPMFALIALRSYNIGNDTGGYQAYFKYVVENPWSMAKYRYRFETGFVMFEKFVSFFTKSPLVYQCVYASIYMFSVVGFANRLKKANFLFLYFFGTLGLYNFMFTAVRQCLAMCICLFSYKYIMDKKIWKFVICVILAFYFHKSALLFLVTYVVFKNKVKPFYIFLYSAGCAFLYYYFDDVHQWFNEQFDYNYAVEETDNGFVFLIVMVVITIFSIYTFTLYKKMNDEARALCNINFIALAFWVLRLVSRTAERPSYYFLFFTAAMLGYAIDSIDDEGSKNTMTMFVVGSSLALFIYRMSTNFSGWIPYELYIAF